MSKPNPAVFIGSSTEGLPLAKVVEKELSSFCTCKIWTHQFDLGNAAYEDLVKRLALYDYGILVATKDDETESRGQRKKAPRDNVIFEFGLFAGHLGRERAFLMAESGIKIPSDLNGITLPFFPSSKKRSWLDSTEKAHERQMEGVLDRCQKIKAHINGRENVFDYGFLPSTALAYGYFNNFVLKVISHLLDVKKVTTVGAPPDGGQEFAFKEIELTCGIPNDLRADMFDQVKAHRHKNKWQVIKVDPGSFRPFDFFIQIQKCSGKKVYLTDIPITLNALTEAIKAKIGKAHVGITEAETLLESREIRNFHDVLTWLIAQNPLTKDRVKVEFVSI